jgi:hypothetical protein
MVHVTSVTKGASQKLPKQSSKHWKALEEHFLMSSLVFRFNHFQGEDTFSQKTSFLEELMA